MLWFGKRYSLCESGLLNGCDELHSHLLPGVDDGVSSYEEAFEILSAFEEMGYRRVEITPHIATRFLDNSSTTLRQAFEELRGRYSGGLELALGAEYRVDENFRSFIDEGDWLLVQDRWLLIETYMSERSLFLGSVIYDLQISGLELMLAHPERYLYMSNGDYESLRDRLVLQQLDLFSLLGLYGSKVERRAKELLSMGCYDTFGSDIHNTAQLTLFKAKKLTAKEIDSLFALR